MRKIKTNRIEMCVQYELFSKSWNFLPDDGGKFQLH